MSTLSQLYSNIVTLMSQTFSKKTDVDASISSHNSNSSAHSTEMAKKVNINQGNSNASKNVVTDSSGNITVEAKPTIPTKTSDLTNDSNYVTTTDSRLSDSRTPTSHTHGSITNDGKIGTASGKLITTGTGGVLQASDSITKSMISDFPSTMTPASHTHGNITNDGKVGSTANKPLITTTNGVVTTGSFGTSANTFCQGNDSRLSDARTPTSHTHGSVSNDGKIGTASGKIITTGTSGVLQASDSITKSMISDFPTSMTPTSHTHTKSEISDFPSTMTPSSHTHGNLQNDGTVKVSNTVQKSKNLVTDANGYLNVEDKITKTSQLTNDSGFLTSHQDISGKADTSHTHGNITSDGKIGTTATLPIITGTGGVLQAGSFGNSAGTFCQGNDSRLSNSRTPTSHASTATTYGVGTTANYGHVKTINGLTQSSHTDGTALSAYQGKVLKDLVDGKASSSHSHTVSNITDFPSIPSKTSDLTNDSGFLTSHQDISGKIDTAGTGLSKSGTTLNHSNSITAVTTAAFKKIKYDAQGHITGTADVTSSDLPSHTHAASSVTDANANNYTNIGSLSSGATQQAINAAINTKIASLTNIDLVNLVTSLPTASASTMNQLYVVAKTGGSGQDTYNIYVTVKSGSTYKWEKIDDFDLQTLSIAWNSVTGKPTFATVATSGSYNDLSNKPSIPTDVADLTDDADYIWGNLEGKYDSDGRCLTEVAFTGSYNDLDNTPTIPTNNNQLTNGAGYITSSAISGKIDTAGTGLSKSGTTLNHSNSITAITTAAFKKIKYDSQGHITGTADVTASDLPSHTHSDYALTSAIPTNNNQLTNGAGYITSSSLPTSTSDLTNDGEDGTNPFVSDDDSRLSDARTPTSHTHGNLTNDGKVGSTANYFVYTTTGGAITSKQKIGNITTSGAIGSTSGLPLKTTTSGVITTGSFGTTSGTFCQGNDSRLHSHTFTYSNGSLTIS